MSKKSRIPVELSDKKLHKQMKAIAALNGKSLPEMIEIAEHYFISEKYPNVLDSIIKV